MTTNRGSTNEAQPRFLNVKELSELLRIKTRTIYEWLARDESHIAKQAIGPSSCLMKFWNGDDQMRSARMPPFLKRAAIRREE